MPQSGNSDNTSINNLPLTAFGDLRVTELSPVFQLSFEYTVGNTDLVENIEVSGGTVTQTQAMAVVNTSTTTGSSALMHSHVPAKYRSGFGGLTRFTALFTTPVAATAQLIGLADAIGSSTYFKNGLTIGYVGTTFGFHRFSNDAIHTVALADWDDPLDGSGDSGLTLGATKLGVWFIGFQYLGAGAVKIFFEDTESGDVILVHTLGYANENTEPSVHNPNFFSVVYADNEATTADLTVKTGSLAYFVEGKTILTELHQPQFSTGLITKAAVTTEVAILTIRNKSLYASKNNFIEIILEEQTDSVQASSANNLASVRLVKNAAIGGTPVWNDINTTNSVVEIDVAGTTVTGGRELRPSQLAGKNDKNADNILPFRIVLEPGEWITVAGASVNSATIKASLLWKELF